ncbi:isoprenylcysteine carboxylmethyltransferase family protein [Prolixibacteraceae bacterium Z1-6]|uniref:Isoprenylcysteine carboxylmethyltransferase family protein n=1 Tax=Draconibacterium aestuarii TaxID=2998507 RepID=A0A9X3FAZ1_9BACT|nr:isoprenylcysteine carboxylmethyltransferase family protein [Prolixibacteraceae bacterium Z1-6]
MIYAATFILLSIPVILISWKSLKNKMSHGFYRFFSWEAILLLIIFKIEYWFTNPFAFHQIVSWLFLIISLWFALAGTSELKKQGKPTSQRNSPELFTFEKSSKLVDTGIYRYIRHPLYSSLLFLSWGTFLKNTDWIFLPVVILSNIFLYFTALADEKECIRYFGNAYAEYTKRTKRFIPFIF